MIAIAILVRAQLNMAASARRDGFMPWLEVSLIRSRPGPEIGPQLQRTQPNSSDVIGSIGPPRIESFRPQKSRMDRDADAF
jgi:hypothetical protein